MLHTDPGKTRCLLYAGRAGVTTLTCRAAKVTFLGKLLHKPASHSPVMGPCGLQEKGPWPTRGFPISPAGNGSMTFLAGKANHPPLLPPAPRAGHFVVTSCRTKFDQNQRQLRDLFWATTSFTSHHTAHLYQGKSVPFQSVPN